MCDTCRNFYLGLDTVCPQLRPFLRQFGIYAEAPDRMSPIGYSPMRIDYDPMYYVYGRIIRYSERNLMVGDMQIVPESADMLFEEGCIFSLTVRDMSLPWLLDEPYDNGLFQQQFASDIPQ